jgi:hypothetical protein
MRGKELIIREHSPSSGRWLVRLARRVEPSAGASDAQALVRLAMFAIALVAQLATILITWSVWTVRTSAAMPPNLPVVPLPTVGFAWIVLISLLAALVYPRGGVMLHGVALLVALAFDQHRLEPQFIGLWVLLWACVSERGAWFARWFLASMWLWAGLHKFLSPEWLGVTSYEMAKSIGLDPQLHFWLALVVAALETGVGVAAIFTRRVAAVLCVAQHAGILLFLSPVAYDFNLSVWPWNAATGIIGAWLFWSGPAVAARFPKTIAQWIVIAALYLVPGTYYLGWINPHLAHILYSEHMPKAWMTTGEGQYERLHAWRNLAVPFPDSHRLFIQNFALRGSPGNKLYIQDPRFFVSDRFLVIAQDGRIVDIDRRRFCLPDASAGALAGIMLDDANAAFLLERMGVELQRESTGPAARRLVVGVKATGVKLGERECSLLAALPNIESLQFHDAQVSASALRQLDVLFALEILDLEGSQISGLQLAELPNRAGLRWLNLNRANVAGGDLAALGSLPRLSLLQLSATKIDDADAAHIAKCAGLTWLDLSGTPVTSAGLQSLAGMKQLEVLNLDVTATDDRAIPYLSALVQLESLQLRNTHITPQGLAELRRNLPGCQIAH